MIQFESGHPDTKSRNLSGSQGGDFGTLGTSGLIHESMFWLEDEGPNSKTKDKMIKSIKIKNTGPKWYVEYKDYDSLNKVWRRCRESGGVNREKDILKRQQKIEELYQTILNSIVNRYVIRKNNQSEIIGYINKYIDDKQNFLRKTSIKNMRLALKYFYNYLCKNDLDKIGLHEVKKEHIHNFRVYLITQTGNRSVNNHISFVRAFFNYYIKNFDDILVQNPCNGLQKLPTHSESHMAYTTEQVQNFYNYLESNNKMLLLYCKFIGLAFVRCEEARNLKVGDIDFTRRTITVSAGYSKTRTRKVKPLLDKFYNILIELGIYNYPPNFYIFSYNQVPGQKRVHYNYFRKQFKKLKAKFGLSAKYSIYSFRHTYVSQMLDNGAKWHEVMKYTGHTTMEAFSNYARSLHVKPAEDLSRYISV